MTAQAKSAPKLPLQRAVVAMASPVASLATSLALAVMASLHATVVARALPRVVLVWVTRLSAPNVTRWNLRKTPCAAWLHKPMAKC
jgi:hypothetical protein